MVNAFVRARPVRHSACRPTRQGDEERERTQAASAPTYVGVGYSGPYIAIEPCIILSAPVRWRLTIGTADLADIFSAG